MSSSRRWPAAFRSSRPVPPGTREIVSAGEDGLLVDRHEPAAFAAALDLLLNDAALRAANVASRPPPRRTLQRPMAIAARVRPRAHGGARVKSGRFCARARRRPGVAIGVVYTLSPLTVWFAVGIVPLVRPGGADLEPDERRWVTRLLIVAVALRVVAVAGLFLADRSLARAVRQFLRRRGVFHQASLWLRNLALGIPIQGLDLESAFQAVNASSHLYLLALIQLLVGPAPYGLAPCRHPVLRARGRRALSSRAHNARPHAGASRPDDAAVSAQPVRLVGVGAQRAAVRAAQLAELRPRGQAGARPVLRHPRR